MFHTHRHRGHGRHRHGHGGFHPFEDADDGLDPYGHGRHGGHRRFARDGHRGGQRGGPDGEGHRHGRRGRGGGQSGLGRFFAHGDLRLVALHLIAERPRHGYDIIKEIEERVAGAYSPSPGVIYPTLAMLEDQGFVTVSTNDPGGKKLHHVTDQGTAFLESNRPALDELLARIDAVGKGAAKDPSDRLAAAMHRLKTALRSRLHDADADETKIEAAVAVLNDAADKLEAM